jgi:hypothetical protein
LQQEGTLFTVANLCKIVLAKYGNLSPTIPSNGTYNRFLMLFGSITVTDVRNKSKAATAIIYYLTKTKNFKF